MKYLDDPDLTFLAFCNNDDLDILVQYLTKTKKGNKRFNETLTSKKSYKDNYPNHQIDWKDIAEELQTYGGNSIYNFFRQTGVSYKEILTDVCKRMKVNFNAKSSVSIIERNLLSKILEDSIEKMTEEEQEPYYVIYLSEKFFLYWVGVMHSNFLNVFI